MRIGVVTFPGSLDDVDARRAVLFGGAEAVPLWHGEHDLRGVDAVVLPGGFSYGDYLRCGAISRFSPVMTEVIEAAGKGMPVLGICNGFQILCESHLLPGALIRNDHRKFVCRDQRLRIENTSTAWTSAYDEGAEVTEDGRPGTLPFRLGDMAVLVGVHGGELGFDRGGRQGCGGGERQGGEDCAQSRLQTSR